MTKQKLVEKRVGLNPSFSLPSPSREGSANRLGLKSINNS